MSDLGHDLSCVSDLDLTGAVVSGRRLLLEACARRLITDRGTLIDDPNYGYNLTAWVNADIGPGDIDSIQSGINAECLKDERVIACSSTVAVASSIMSVSIALVDGDGPFTLVLKVSDVTIELLTVSP